MAQAQPDKSIKDVQENIGLNNNNNNIKNNNNMKKKMQKKKKKGNSNAGGGAFKFNVEAQEFVPKSIPPEAVPISGYFVPCLKYGGGAGGAQQWIFVSDKDVVPVVANGSIEIPASECTKNNDVLTEQIQNKIIKQVEYQLSDMSLLANKKLVKEIQNDPEGFVPISLVSATKKLKSIITSNRNFLAEALHASTKLEVSCDGTRVKRKNPFTHKEKEELQARTVVAENLPDDHSHQNLEKIFNVAGVVKTIRVCHPQEASSRGKGDGVISTKLHALVEFENTESAEKTVEKFSNDKKSAKGLRVRLLLRRTPRSVLKSRKSAFDGYLDEEEDNSPVQQKNNTEPFAVDNSVSAQTNSRLKGKSKPQKQRSPTHSGRVLPSQSSLPANTESSAKQTIKGPRMPDGTKGFNIGRGRPFTIPV